MADEKSNQNGQIIAFTIAAAAIAAIAGIVTYLIVMRRLAGDPEEILNRCQDAITRIEKEIAGAKQ